MLLKIQFCITWNLHLQHQSDFCEKKKREKCIQKMKKRIVEIIANHLQSNRRDLMLLFFCRSRPLQWPSSKHQWWLTAVVFVPRRFRIWQNPTPLACSSTLFLETRSRTWTVWRISATPHSTSRLPWFTWSPGSLRRSGKTRYPTPGLVCQRSWGINLTGLLGFSRWPFFQLPFGVYFPNVVH